MTAAVASRNAGTASQTSTNNASVSANTQSQSSNAQNNSSSSSGGGIKQSALANPTQSVVVNGKELSAEFLSELHKSFSKNIVKVRFNK
jgi:hypothetical protein